MNTKALLLLFALYLTHCEQKRTEKVEEKSQVFDANKDYFPDKVILDYAQNFSVEYFKNYKVVRARIPFSNTKGRVEADAWEDGFSDVMVLVQKGTPQPELSGPLEGAHVIEVPVSSIAGNADDAPTRFLAINAVDKIVGLGHKDIYEPSLKKKIESGDIAAIGASWHVEPNVEVLLTVKPEVCLLTASSLEQASGIDKTRSLGIRAAPEFSWSEATYLGKLEWIKYDALFLNAEHEANDYFTKIKRRCDSLSTLVAQKEERPQVMWAYHSRSGAWVTRVNDPFAQLIQLAGGINPYADSLNFIAETAASTGLTEGVMISDEVILRKAAELDYIISFQKNTKNWPSDKYMAHIPAFKNRKLFHHFKRYTQGASDWYQSAAMRPDLVLTDLIYLFHPDVLPDHELFYLEPMVIE